MNADRLTLETQRLRRALYALDAPPLAVGLNHAELADAIDSVPRKPAAVLIPLLPREGRLTVLFTRRTEHLNHHAGQISFPGGRSQAGDADALAVALRETQEEIGVMPEQVHPIGYLDCCETVSGFCVTPVVGYVDPLSRFVPDPLEVAEIFEVPFEFFLEQKSLRRREIDFRGRLRNVYEFVYGEHTIWGATAAMLVNLRDRLEHAQ